MSIERSEQFTGDVAQESDLDIRAILIQINQTLNNTNKNIQELKTDTNQNFVQQEKQFTTIIDNLRTETRQNIENLEKKVNEAVHFCLDTEVAIQNKLEQYTTELDKKIEGECKKVFTDNISPLQKELDDLKDTMKDRLRANADKINVVINPGLFRQEPTQKYYGDYKINPKIYIKNLKVQIDSLGHDIEIKKYLRMNFGGDAELWFDIVTEKFDTFEQFEKLFLDYYWGQETQSKIRQNLFSGKYNETFGSTREKYAMRKFATAKQLDPAMSEFDIIQHIARHFETDICDIIAIHEIRDIDRLLTYLRRIDDARQTRQKIRTNRTTLNTNTIRRDGGRIEQNNCSMKTDYRSRNDKDGYLKSQQQHQETRRYEENYDNQRKQDQETRRNEENYDNRRTQEYYRRKTTSPRREEDNYNSRTYGRPYTRSPTRYDNNQGKNNMTNADKRVQFDEIAVVHDDTKTNQNF